MVVFLRCCGVKVKDDRRFTTEHTEYTEKNINSDGSLLRKGFMVGCMHGILYSAIYGNEQCLEY